MNIGELRSILGDAVSNEVRTLELKIGQVVRGVVTQQLDNNEAIVNINGVQVKAKLEVPLSEGQVALLTVQPESKGSYILLKQVDPATIGFSDPMKDILKAMGLPDKQWAMDVIKGLRADGIALNKETTSAFQRAMAAIPQGMNIEQWVEAAGIAARRGLPMTEATLLGISQLMNGTPIHSLMEQLRGQLQAMLQGSNQSSQTSTSQNSLHVLLQQLSNSLEEGQQISRSLLGQAEQLNASSTSRQDAILQSSAQPLSGRGVVENVLTANVATQTMDTQANVTSTLNNSALGQLLKWLGVDHEMVLGKQLLGGKEGGTVAGSINSSSTLLSNPLLGGSPASLNQTNAMSIGSHTGGTQHTTQDSLLGNQNTALQGQQPSTSNSSAAPVASQASVGLQAQALATALNSQSTQSADTTALSKILTNTNPQVQDSVVGIEQKQVQTSQLNQHPANVNTNPMLINSPSHPTLSEGNGNQLAPESLKATLMQLLTQPELPVAVKETAQQLLHAVTGQQLMMTTERNNAMFSHMMMYIPLQDQEGSQTAKVHVQTRRDRKGAMDAENCRIVFDLTMKNLGATLIDVHITSKVISLHVWNDHAAVKPLLERLKPSVHEALLQTGYSLSSLRTTSLTERAATVNTEKELPSIEVYSTAQRYKGVDIKA